MQPGRASVSSTGPIAWRWRARQPTHRSLLAFIAVYVFAGPALAIVEEEFEWVEFSRPAAHQSILEVVKHNEASAEMAKTR